MADHNLPGTNDTKTNIIAYLKNRLVDVCGMLDPQYKTPTNIPTDAYRFDTRVAGQAKIERYNGAAWVSAASAWSISITGNAATATAWATGRTITLTGDVSGVSGAWTGSGNITFATTLATVAAAKGGTGQTAYTIGDLLYASGASALSKLAGVATGNALISGGVGAAPSWGKIGLTTHVSGVLGITNGGLNLSTYTTGDILYASGTNVLAKLAAAAAGNVLISGATPSWGKVALTSHVSGTLPVANGGTGGADAATARTNLGLGTAATQNVGTGASNVVQLDGSSALPAVSGAAVTNVKWQGSTKHVSTAAPTSGDGADGDIWFEREA